MKNRTRDELLKSAACFSVLCALGIGLSTGNLMASSSAANNVFDNYSRSYDCYAGLSGDVRKHNKGESPVQEEKQIDNPFSVVRPESRAGINVPKTYITRLNKCPTVLAVDGGSGFDVVVKGENGSWRLKEDSLSQKKFVTHPSYTVNNLISDRLGVGRPCSVLTESPYETILDITQRKYGRNMGAVSNEEAACLRYCRRFKPKETRAERYALAPSDLPCHIFKVQNGKYVCDPKTSSQIQLTQEDYMEALYRTQFSAVTRRERSYISCATIHDDIERDVSKVLKGGKIEEKDKLTISLTCSDALKGYALECHIAAEMCVFESAGGKLCSFSAAWERIKSGNTAFKYDIFPQSLAAQACYFYENNNKFFDSKQQKDSKAKVVLVNYGHNGLSVSSSEYDYDGMTVHQGRYFTDCGGQVIDQLIFNAFVKKMRCDPRTLPPKYIDHILSAVINTKEKLSAEGASNINVSIEIGEEDYDFTFSVTELNAILDKAKITDSFVCAVETYIKAHATDLGIKIDKYGNVVSGGKFEMVIVGGSLRIPYLKEKLLKILEKYGIADKPEQSLTLNQTLNMDECCAFGAAYLGSWLRSDPIPRYSCDVEKFKEFDGFSSDVLDTLQYLYDCDIKNKTFKAFTNELEGCVYALEGALPNFDNKWELASYIRANDRDGYIRNLDAKLSNASFEKVITERLMELVKHPGEKTLNDAISALRVVEPLEKMDPERKLKEDEEKAVMRKKEILEGLDIFVGEDRKALGQLREMHGWLAGILTNISQTSKLLWIFSADPREEDIKSLTKKLINNDMSGYFQILESIIRGVMDKSPIIEDIVGDRYASKALKDLCQDIQSSKAYFAVNDRRISDLLDDLLLHIESYEEVQENVRKRNWEMSQKRSSRQAKNGSAGSTNTKRAEYSGSGDVRHAGYSSKGDVRYAEYSGSGDVRHAGHSSKGDLGYAEYSGSGDVRHAGHSSKGDVRHAGYSGKENTIMLNQTASSTSEDREVRMEMLLSAMDELSESDARADVMLKKQQTALKSGFENYTVRTGDRWSLIRIVNNLAKSFYPTSKERVELKSSSSIDDIIKLIFRLGRSHELPDILDYMDDTVKNDLADVTSMLKERYNNATIDQAYIELIQFFEKHDRLKGLLPTLKALMFNNTLKAMYKPLKDKISELITETSK